MLLVGRQREQWMADNVAASEAGAACVFIADPGLGKTALLNDIARRYQTDVVTISPNERMWPYSGLSAVGSALGGSRGAAVDGILARCHDWPEHMVAEELSRTLRLVKQEPCLLVVDDLDAMDVPSATVLSYVFGRLRGTGVNVIASATVLDARHAFAGLPHMHLAPLEPADAIEVARAVFGPDAARGALHIVAAFTGGVPAIIEHVRLTADEAAGAAAMPLPLRLHGADDRLRERSGPAHDPATAALLDALAISPVSVRDVLTSLSSAPATRIDDLIESGTLIAHGGLVRFADPVRRLRRHAGIDTDDRRRLHRLAADAHDGVHRGIHAWHTSFLDAPRTGDADLLTIATEFAASGDPATAVEFAERALGGSVSDDDRARLLVALGDALRRQGHFVLAQFYLRRAATPATSTARLTAAVAELMTSAMVDHVVDDALVDAFVQDSDDDDAVTLLTAASRIRLERGDLDLAALRVAEGRRRVGRSDSLALELLERLIGAVSSASPSGAAPTAAPSLSVATASPDVAETTLQIALDALDEQYVTARRLIGALRERSPRLDPIWRERVLTLLVLTEVRAGDASAARDAVAAWRREWLPEKSADANTVLLLAQAAALEPGGEGLAELIHQGRALCHRNGTPALLPGFDVLEGSQALADGRYDDAVRSLHSAVVTAPDDPALLRADADLIEALWLSRRCDEAQERLARFDAAAGRHPRRWTTLALARAHAVCRADDPDAAAFHEVEAMYRADDSPDAYARLLAARERRHPRSSALIRVASAPRPAAWEGALTPQEREVVALVDQGLRNREIAAALFVSMRTVELRLTNVYRKLGVRSRAHLVSVLHEGR